MLKHYLLERVLRHYVQNVEEVLQQISIPRLLFGSIRLRQVQLVPESVQDALSSYVFLACEFTRVVACDVEVSVEWLSIATRSVQFRIQCMEVEMMLHDPSILEAARDFWEAQTVRLRAEMEYMKSPAESTTLYKVLGGLDVVVKGISVQIWTPEHSQPQLLASISGFRYCPATQAGAPTNDLPAAMRPNPDLEEVAYNYWLEVGCLLFSLPPAVAQAAGLAGAGTAGVALEGLTFSSFGKVPASGQREAAFYATAVNSLEARELKTSGTGPLALGALLRIIEVLSRAWVSDDLRETLVLGGAKPAASSPEPHASTTQADALPGELQGPGGSTSAQAEEARLRERLLAAQRTRSDMADLLAGCSRTSGQASEKAHKPVIDEDAEDGEDFMDCEEPGDEGVDIGGQPGCMDGSPRSRGRCRKSGALKRFIFGVRACRLHVLGQEGVVAAEFADFWASTDKRRGFSPQEAECISSLFGFRDSPSSSSAKRDAGDSEPGMMYAGLSLASAGLTFSLGCEHEPQDVFRLPHGLKLWHRGCADSLYLGAGPPLMLLEVQATGLCLRDHGREALTAMSRALMLASAPSPTAGVPQPSGPEAILAYSLEALDVCLEAGCGGSEASHWRCTLPCLRLSSVLRGVEDLWAYTSWNTPVIRSPADQLGSTAVEPTARPWWEPPKRPTRTEPPLRPRAANASDVVAELGQRLEGAAAELATERARAAELEAKLGEVLKVLRTWPEGPMPLALQNMVAEPLCLDDRKEPAKASGVANAEAADPQPRDAGHFAAPLQQGVEVATYGLDFREATQHVVEGLRRGDVVQWFVEEVEDRPLDVRAVLRSRRKLHAARCLRETEHTSRRRDFFEVTDDFGEDQLPLALEIHLSNGSWWAARRVRLRLCRVDGKALRSGTPPWPALAPFEEE